MLNLLSPVRMTGSDVLDVKGAQSWEVYDENGEYDDSAAPLAAYLDELRSSVRSAATEP